MNKRILTALLFLALPELARADSQWVLEQSTLTYHVSHPFHSADGISHAAQGKGSCHAIQCDFLVTVPVKSFDSGSSRRDRHMLHVTHGAEFPLVTVRIRLPEAELASATIHADLEIQFAGETATYRRVPFERMTQGKEVRVTGTIPATVSDFKIDPPSLFRIPIKNQIPVRVDTTWRRR